MKESIQAKLMLSAAMVIFGTLGVFTRNIGVTSGELALYRAQCWHPSLSGFTWYL